MAFTVTLYQFSKKTNSTATPGNVLTKTLDCVLKDDTSIVNPSIVVSASALTSPAMYNYARIANFNRYYFIADWTYSRGTWIASLNVDVLASYKAAIGDSAQYILRSASKYVSTLADSEYPLSTYVQRSTVTPPLYDGSLWSNGDDMAKGWYVLGIINNDPNAIGSVAYYAMTHAQIRTFLHVLMGDFNWLNVTEVTQELTQALFNPFQYIASCRWYPVVPTFISSVTELPYGWWTLPGVAAVRIDGKSRRFTNTSFNIPTHPLKGDDSEYLNASPYTEAVAFIEPWGSFEIPLGSERPSLTLYTDVDFVTGKGVLSIATASGDIIAYREGSVGVDIQLSQMATNVLGVVSGVMSSASSVVKSALSGNLGGAISNAVSGIVSTVEDSVPSLSTKGLNGSPLSFKLPPKIVMTYHMQTQSAPDRFGRPYAKTDIISNHSGYIMCANPTLSTPLATPGEIEQICGHMSAGFYYE